MGLTSVLAAAAKSAMAAAGDLKTTVTVYQVNGEPTYDDETGTYTTLTLSDVNIEALLYEFEANEVVRQVGFETDQKVLIESRFLVRVSTPEYFDIGGIRWDVISPLNYPSDAIREFHVRNTGEPI